MARERLLIRTLVDLADSTEISRDSLGALDLLCERAVAIIDADAAGVLLMNGVGDLEVGAASSQEMRELGQAEVCHRRGPCVQAHRTGARVDHADLAAGPAPWPEFAAAALARGLASVHARPLRLRDQPIGALSILRRETGRVSDDDAAVVAGLADMAAIGIVHDRAVSAAQHQVSDLRRALDKRAVVDQAVAVLADRSAVDHGAAFEWLRRYARNHNQRLRDVAQRFLRGELDADALAPP